MATYIHIKDTRYTMSQVRAMRKDELITHVLGLSAEINRLNREIKALNNDRARLNREVEAVNTAKKTTAKKTTAKKTATKTWKDVVPEAIHASFKLAGVTQTMQRRATFALNRGDSPEAVADFAVGTRRNKRWEKIMNGAVKARA